MLKVAAFTGSRSISSRRFRVMQYVPGLAKADIDVDEFISRFGSWPPTQNLIRPLWLVGTVLDRIAPVVRSYDYDLTLLQREFVSTLRTLEGFTHRPRVLDVDDAVWTINRRAQRTFQALVEMSDGVICGNDFIANHVRQWNEKILVQPTPVDTSRFFPDASRPKPKQIIGWSGLHSGTKYLLDIESALYAVLKTRSDVMLRVVSDAPPKFRRLDASMVEFVRWSPENEVPTIQQMSIGLMPIDDTPWSRGKCSYKMLLYMSCGVPMVVSPFGMNAEILRLGRCGFGAITENDWVESIGFMLDNVDAAQAMGRTGRSIVESRYSLATLTAPLADFLKEIAAHHGSRN